MDVGVLIAVFNNLSGLRRSLDSLRYSRDCRFEVLVVDDGSSPPIELTADDTQGVPVRIIRLGSNRGLAGALNVGLACGNWKYVARLDAGDTIRPDRLVRQANVLENDTEVALVSSWVDFVQPDTRRHVFRYTCPSADYEIRRALRYRNTLLHPAVMFRSTHLAKVGPYNEAFRVSEDYELFMRLGRVGLYRSIPEVLTQTECSVTGISSRYRRAQLIQCFRVQMAYFEPNNLHSYLGIGRTLGLLVPPRAAVLKAKEILSTVRHGTEPARGVDERMLL
ncbi:MAG: glycosyltransferase [Acidobacteria bacterium]|nr:glycosyltransferase [Acidobacteriota bacterium]